MINAREEVDGETTARELGKGGVRVGDGRAMNEEGRRTNGARACEDKGREAHDRQKCGRIQGLDGARTAQRRAKMGIRRRTIGAWARKQGEITAR